MKSSGISFKPKSPVGKNSIGTKDFRLSFKMRAFNELEGIQSFVGPTPLNTKQTKQPIPTTSSEWAQKEDMHQRFPTVLTKNTPIGRKDGILKNSLDSETSIQPLKREDSEENLDLFGARSLPIMFDFWLFKTACFTISLGEKYLMRKSHHFPAATLSNLPYYSVSSCAVCFHFFLDASVVGIFFQSPK